MNSSFITSRPAVRYAIHAASQLHGLGTLMWMMPKHLHVTKTKNDYGMMVIGFLTLSRRTGIFEMCLYPPYLHIYLMFCGK